MSVYAVQVSKEDAAENRRYGSGVTRKGWYIIVCGTFQGPYASEKQAKERARYVNACG